MKKPFTLLLMCVLLCTTICAAAFSNNPITVLQQPDLATYAGKYQMMVKGKPAYIEIRLADKELTLTSLWDKQTKNIKRLSGDNFIMLGQDWSVKFIRDSNGKITDVLVMGTDRWTKVNG